MNPERRRQVLRLPRLQMPHPPAWLTRRRLTLGALAVAATAVTIAGWQQTLTVLAGLLRWLLGWMAPAGRAWPPLVVALVAAGTSPQDRARLRYVPQAGRMAAITGGLKAGVVVDE